MVAHVFSGHRRPGDVQEMLEKMNLPGHNLHVLSIDIIFSEQYGNLVGPKVFHKFKQASSEGLLVALAAGPPCEP